MNDLIDRQAAIDAAKDWYDGLICGSFRGLEKRLKSLPSAQPEIVRCKDCRYDHDCNIQYHAQAGDEFYCGAAERRTDG